MALFDFFKKKPSEEEKGRLDEGLEKTRSSFLNKLSKAVVGKSKVNDDFLDELEEILIVSVES